MPVVEQKLTVRAPPSRVFDLARSVDLHVDSAAASSERAVGGVTHGLLAPGDEVVWRARHLGVLQELTSKVTLFDRPNYFRDTMVRGAFARFDHDHYFREVAGGCAVLDRFDFDTPFGAAGRIVNALFLTRYMRRFLEERNAAIKRVAESSEWKRYLRDGE